MPFWNRLKQDWHIRAYMLLLAVLLWVVVVMTREYETTVSVAVTPVNIQSGKILVSDQPEPVPVRFSGQGKDLFLLSTFRPAHLDLDLRTIEQAYAYPLDPDMVDIPNGISVVPLYMPGVDTVHVRLEDRHTRRLPVVPNLDVRTRAGYVVADSTLILPDSVNVSGPASTVDRLKRIYTEERVFVGLTESFREETPLVQPKNVWVVPSTVTLDITIDRLGERVINRVPVEVRGNPQGRLVILEPSVVDVRVKGPAARLATITVDSLAAWVSFTQWRSDTRAYPPRIELPNGVELMDTTPDVIRMRLEGGLVALTVLAVESSCDETAASIVRDGRVIVNLVATQEIHSAWGGVVPELASRLHQRTLTRLVNDALEQASLAPSELDAFASTTGPGLIGALLVGASYAKGMAVATGKPFIGVNHLEGHLWSAAVDTGSLPLPALILLVSGGHTELVRIDDFGDYTYLGATLDDAAGEAFDKVGGLLGIPYPAGAALSKLAAAGNDRAIPFKVANTERPLDFSFSGLKSAALREVHRLEADASVGERKADVAASFQRAVIRQLESRVKRALDGGNFASLSLGGGVAANRPLRETLARIAGERKLPLLVPPFEYCTDNAAMIAWVAYERLRRGQLDPLDHPADPNLTLVAGV